MGANFLLLQQTIDLRGEQDDKAQDPPKTSVSILQPAISAHDPHGTSGCPGHAY